MAEAGSTSSMAMDFPERKENRPRSMHRFVLACATSE